MKNITLETIMKIQSLYFQNILYEQMKFNFGALKLPACFKLHLKKIFTFNFPSVTFKNKLKGIRKVKFYFDCLLIL